MSTNTRALINPYSIIDDYTRDYTYFPVFYKKFLDLSFFQAFLYFFIPFPATQDQYNTLFSVLNPRSNPHNLFFECFSLLSRLQVKILLYKELCPHKQSVSAETNSM